MPAGRRTDRAGVSGQDAKFTHLSIPSERRSHSRGRLRRKPTRRAYGLPQLIGDLVTHWHKFGERRKTVAFATSVATLVHIRDEFVNRAYAPSISMARHQTGTR